MKRLRNGGRALCRLARAKGDATGLVRPAGARTNGRSAWLGVPNPRKVGPPAWSNSHCVRHFSIGRSIVDGSRLRCISSISHSFPPRRNHSSGSTSSTSSSSTTTTSLDRKWFEISQRLLMVDPSTTTTHDQRFGPIQFHEAEEALKYWISSSHAHDDDDKHEQKPNTNNHGRTALWYCWEILDRLAVEAATDQREGAPVETPDLTDLVLQVVRVWQTASREHRGAARSFEGSGRMRPSRAAQKIAHYHVCGLCSPSRATTTAGRVSSAVHPNLHAMVLDVAASWSGDSPGEGLAFADRYLRDWIEDYGFRQGEDARQRSQTNQRRADNSFAAPDAVAVGTVLKAWENAIGQPHPHGNNRIVGPEDAEAFAEEMLEALPHLTPNEFWYATLITAWAKAGNPDRALDVRKRMQNACLEPDLTLFNILLGAYARDPADRASEQDRSAAVRNAAFAEELLRDGQHAYREGRWETAPNAVSYSTVMNAWARASWNNPEAAHRAQRLLDEMKQDATDDTIQPNGISYNTVLTAHSRAGNTDAAEALLYEMIQHAESDSTAGDSAEATGVRPNQASFAAVLSGLSRVRAWEAAEKAERILRELMPRLGVEPNVATYSNCIACWAQVELPRRHRAKGGARTPGAVVARAQALFDELKGHFDPDMRPDVVSYTSLMNAYARHGRPEQVEAIMAELQTEHDRHGETEKSLPNEMSDPQRDHLKPNVRTFSVLLSAWAHSNDPGGAERAEEWLRRMASDEFGVEPNVVSYSTVLNAWSRRARKQTDAPDRARALLDYTRTHPNPRVRPNVISYTTVVRAYAEQGRAREAQELLEEMLDKSNPAPSPDLHTFSSVLNAWSRTASKNPLEVANQAEALLVRMQELYQADVLRQPPNLICFTSVLKCWAKVRNGGAERAETILRSMEPAIQPNLVAKNIVLNAWASQARVDQDILTRAWALLGEIREDPTMIPDAYTFGAVYKAISRSRSPNKQDLMHHLLEEMNDYGIDPRYVLEKKNHTQKRRENKEKKDR